ncbi:MAG: SH3 domain-containing protein [Polyangiaceae bacterium]|nr:SH3 domain-containing protein [Polyangiaceae bacterium]
MTASDRGPLADLLHLLGALSLVGAALCLAVAVIWHTVRTPSDDPLRLPESQGVDRARETGGAAVELPPPTPNPSPDVAAATNASGTGAGITPGAVTPGSVTPSSVTPGAPGEVPAASPAGAPNDVPSLPAGFFQPSPAAVVHEVFGTATDKEPYLALRSRPTREATLLGKLPDGTQLKVVNRFGKWQFVQVIEGDLKGTEGFVYSKYVRPFGGEYR